MIKITCSGCGGKLEAPEEYIGRTAKCKKCGQALLIAVSASTPTYAPVSTRVGTLRVAHPLEMENGVRELLGPGEALRAYCDMCLLPRKQDVVVAGSVEFVAAVTILSALASPEERTNTVMLSNKSLGFIPKKVSFFGKRSLVGIGECKRIPLGMISGVVSERSRNRHVWHLTFSDPALNLTLASAVGLADPAVAFIDELETALSTKGESIADEVGKLAVLAKEGIVSPEEFAKAKEVYLGKAPDRQEAAVTNLRQLYSLLRSGVLTEGEFRLKKWDILSRP